MVAVEIVTVKEKECARSVQNDDDRGLDPMILDAPVEHWWQEMYRISDAAPSFRDWS